MRCIFCYDGLVNNHNPSKSNDIKDLITYYKIYGISSLKKHVDANHAIIAKTFEEGVHSPIKGPIERQPTNKKFNVSNTIIPNVFTIKTLSKT